MRNELEINVTRVIGIGVMGAGVLTLGWTVYPALISLLLVGLVLLVNSALKLDGTEIKAHPDRKWE